MVNLYDCLFFPCAPTNKIVLFHFKLKYDNGYKSVLLFSCNLSVGTLFLQSYRCCLNFKGVFNYKNVYFIYIYYSQQKPLNPKSPGGCVHHIWFTLERGGG